MLVFDIVNPVELASFVRELDPAAYGFTLRQFLPDQTREDVEYAFNRFTTVRRDVASYRAFDAEAGIAARPGFERVRGQIPPISQKMLLGEEQRLRLQALRGYDAGLADQVFDDAAFLTEDVLGRIEFARGEALFNGEVTFANDGGFGTDIKADYGPVTALTAPGTLWSTHSTATPVADLIVMIADYKAANGGRSPGVILTSTSVINHVLQCSEVKNILAVGGIAPPIVTLEQLNRILGSHNIPPMVAYDTEVSVDGSSTRVTPLTKLAMLPAPNVASFGETTFGLTAESMELIDAGYMQLSTAPGLVAVNSKTFDPVSVWTKVAGIVVPVVKDTAKIGTATVIA